VEDEGKNWNCAHGRDGFVELADQSEVSAVRLASPPTRTRKTERRELQGAHADGRMHACMHACIHHAMRMA